MAVIQISKIQVRRGAIGDQALPQLASGELGWAIDTQQLFIGNGSVAEGSPAVGNTEILTETRLFDLLSDSKFTATNYTYRVDNPLIQTGADANNPIVRTLQAKLDESSTVFDFGASSTATDCTKSFQRAVTQEFAIRIPAGSYSVTGTIYVPSNTTIHGDGMGTTEIIALNNQTIFAVANGEDQVANVKISGLTLSYNTNTSLLSGPLVTFNTATNSCIDEVEFKGYYYHSTSSALYTAIELRTWAELGGISISNCLVDNICYPIIANDDVRDISITDNTFKDLYQGITLGTDILGITPRQFGPKRVDIQNNLFKNIERPAIVAGANTGTNTGINSENNTFINVGNVLLNGEVAGDDQPATAVIKFDSHGNSSVNDNFERLWNVQSGLASEVIQQPLVEGTALVKLKFTDKKTLPTTSVAGTLIRLPYRSSSASDQTTSTSVTIDYTFNSNNVSRKGVLSVIASDNGVAVRDQYAIAGDSGSDGLVFTAERVSTENPGVDNPDTLAVQYINTNASGVVAEAGVCVYNVLYYR
jgi:hypothetical protein